jgi:hypothetical protein
MPTTAQLFAVPPASTGQIGPVHPTFFREWERDGDFFLQHQDLDWEVLGIHAQSAGGRGPCAKLSRHIQLCAPEARGGIIVVFDHDRQLLTSRGWVEVEAKAKENQQENQQENRE